MNSSDLLKPYQYLKFGVFKKLHSWYLLPVLPMHPCNPDTSLDKGHIKCAVRNMDDALLRLCFTSAL